MNNFIKNLNPEISENLFKNYQLFGKNYQNYFYELLRRNIADISLNSNSKIIDDNKIILDYFNKKVLVDLKERTVSYIKITGNKYKDFLKESEVDLFSSSIILHFLLNADGTAITGKWISYMELPDGLFYSRTIPEVLKPLINKFENNGKLFLQKATQMGGIPDSSFKFSAVIYPFRMFPALIIFEEKSEEFDADARILFDRSASHYLKTDIIKTMIVLIVKKFISD
ncbi:MAG: DUF3786 domain-containing protein [Actinobacteria bacterium]|nr:DUF3786 domain-containing protein [Actinomycetota bacterium]